MAEKKAEFVVTDRRRFGTEGEPRPDAQVAEEEKPASPPKVNQAAPPAAHTTAPAKPPAAPPQAQQAGQPAGGASVATEHQEEMPAPPTAEEQHQQNEAYKASGKKIDDMIAAAGKAGDGPIHLTFEHVIESIFVSALIQLGLYPPGTETRRVDIIGARQSIDSLEILLEKTKGNLTDNEKTMLQGVLFQLRMAFVETINHVAANPTPGAAPPLDKK
jgi:hypothetical protein